MSEHTVDTSRMPFVGRIGELRELHHWLQKTIEAKTPGFVLVQGDYGVGKTALIEHFLSQAVEQRCDILIGRGRCVIETEHSGLIPFSQLLESLIKHGIQRRVLLTSLLNFTKEVAPAWLDIVTLGAATATVKTVEEGAKLFKHSTFAQESVYVQYANALKRLAEKQPLICFIDDLQWADSSSLGLLFHLARYLEERTILFIVAYRPVTAMETGPNAALFRQVRANLIRHGAVEMSLEQGIDLSEYLALRYAGHRFPAEFTMQIQEKTGGHALFVSQLFSMWQETGVVARELTAEGTQWVLTRPLDPDFSIPPEISEVLDERLRLMEQRLREILTCASVEGQDFTAQVLMDVCQLEDCRVYDDLEVLEERYRLVEEQSTRAEFATILDFYRFIHRFFRDHIYEQLGAGKRRILHRRVGECLESLYKHRSPIAAQLSSHFHLARDFPKAVHYALMAAEFEHARYAWPEGERWCRFGLLLLDEMLPGEEVSRLRLGLLEQSAKGYYHAGDYEQADKLYRETLQLAQQLDGAPDYLANLSERMADICEEHEAYAEAMDFLELGYDILRHHGVLLGESQLKLAVMESLLHSRFGRHQQAAELARQVLTQAQGLDHTSSLESIRADAYNHMAIALGYLGRYSESVSAYRQAISIAKGIGKLRTVAFCLCNVADDYTLIGELDLAETSISEALEISARVGDQDLEIFALNVKGCLRLQQGMLQCAQEDLERAIALSQQLGQMPQQQAWLQADLALTYLAMQNREKALKHASESVQAAGSTRRRAYALDVLGRTLLASQQWAQAAECFEQALELRSQAGGSIFMAQTQRNYARALAGQGELSKANALLQAALATFEELGLDREVDATRELLEENAERGTQ